MQVSDCVWQNMSKWENNKQPGEHINTTNYLTWLENIQPSPGQIVIPLTVIIWDLQDCGDGEVEQQENIINLISSQFSNNHYNIIYHKMLI